MKLHFNRKTDKENYALLYKLNVGDVVRVSDYETVMRRVDEYCPKNLKFELTPITPGTDLYTMYGCEHAVVTRKEITA